jgi:protein-tyrosine phosphatase
MSRPLKKLLFLCTGNYYRSRFAEILFNHLAVKNNLAWRAYSRGLKQDVIWSNLGPISIYTVYYLLKNGILSSQFFRFPKKVRISDFKVADHTIALKESEHRVYMKNHFPELETKIEYWKIDDVDVAPPAEVLPDLEIKIMELVAGIDSTK